jgi:putative acetyltransferase
MNILSEAPIHYQAIHAVNSRAFATPNEANLVDVLRKQVWPYISLVAEEDGNIVGHILFTPVTLSSHAELKIMELGPMAVLPEHQGKGIGSALVRAGLEKCTEISYGAVVVLGHPGFYPRFGFLPSVNFGIRYEYDVLPEVFMIMELIPGYLQTASGVIHYHPAFDNV